MIRRSTIRCGNRITTDRSALALGVQNVIQRTHKFGDSGLCSLLSFLDYFIFIVCLLSIGGAFEIVAIARRSGIKVARNEK